MSDSMDEVLVYAEALSKSYTCGHARVNAVREATFRLDRGTRVALVGPSGGGKTTLLHLMSGLDRPSGGTIEWPALGPVGGLRPKHVAVSFQSPSLLPALTTAENVALPLLLAGVPEERAANSAKEMLKTLALDGLAERLPAELSGGQSQRVALARALVAKPALLLADEPTGQQDRAHGTRLMDMLLELAVENEIAVVVATHDPEVAALLEHTWTMIDGSLYTGGS